MGWCIRSTERARALRLKQLSICTGFLYFLPRILTMRQAPWLLQLIGHRTRSARWRGPYGRSALQCFHFWRDNEQSIFDIDQKS